MKNFYRKLSLKKNSKKCFSFVSLKKETEKIYYLTIDNSKKRNALSMGVLLELQSTLNELKERNSKSQGIEGSIVILKTIGPVFSSGHDLKELQSFSIEDQKKTFELCGNVMEQITCHPSIFIAQVHGLATAAGLQLAATCDITIASEDADFATPGVKIGLFCTTPSVALSKVVSSKRAMHMLLTGENINAKTALEWGLVNSVFSKNKLEEETLNYARSIEKYSSQTYSLGKQAFYKQLKMTSLNEKYGYASEIMCQNFNYSDCKEGVKAFVEKRKPEFKF